MGDKSAIEWTDATWNPVTGCAKISQGCKHCYAEREWPRLTKLVPAYAGRAFRDVRTHADRLDQPLRWKKPRRVFVNSMSDLFHEAVPFEFIDRVFAVMALAPQHTFQVLTKRAERMHDYLLQRSESMCASDWPRSNPVAIAMSVASKARGDALPGNAPLHLAGNWPLPNVWLGVSVEDQAAADERIPLLLKAPSAGRWISAEPLLGPVSFDGLFANTADIRDGTNALEALDWVVAGGESGPKARPMHPAWARLLRDQCAAAGVPFLFKQWGEWAPRGPIPGGDEASDLRKGVVQYMIGDGREFDGHFRRGDVAVRRVGKRAAGRLLDGVLHDSYPEVLR
jgi:protein gp37